MANKILLTGAGFSANFGAPLASEMSNIIFNNSNIQNQKNLRKLIQKNQDYEDVYQKVMNGTEYNPEEKRCLHRAIEDAYKKVDNRIMNYQNVSQTYGKVFVELIFPFAKRNGGSGFIFTLNQDLLIESRFGHYLKIPSIELRSMESSVFEREWGKSLSNEDKVFLPCEKAFNDKKIEYEKNLNKGEVQLSYIKLHGSQEWFSNNESNIMLIGHEKEENIKSIPLLNWYFDLFNQQLNVQDTKLLIIGYGFNDKHINESIANAPDNLKLYIINTQPWGKFLEELKNKPHAERIFDRINRYDPLSLRELFPNDSNPHPDWNDLKSQFFDDK